VRALITGISGQDGSYLSEHLLSLGYEVFGIVRRNSVPEHQSSRIQGLDVTTVYGDVTDYESVVNALKLARPDEVYNLAAQSHVRISFDVPHYTVQTNAVGAMNVFRACLNVVPDARVYQASSSEMFGTSVDDDYAQRETTPMHPTSPYGCAKLFAYSMARHMRRAYGMWIANGILFNHESPKRGSNFVTTKVIRGALDIQAGRATELRMGNLDSKRDWGDSRDYVKAMVKILHHSEPDDFVIATGQTRSVRDLCKHVFSRLGMNYHDCVIVDEKYLRPQELPYLRGDATKAKTVLGWSPEISFEQTIDDMIEAWTSNTQK